MCGIDFFVCVKLKNKDSLVFVLKKEEKPCQKKNKRKLFPWEWGSFMSGTNYFCVKLKNTDRLVFTLYHLIEYLKKREKNMSFVLRITYWIEELKIYWKNNSKKMCYKFRFVFRFRNENEKLLKCSVNKLGKWISTSRAWAWTLRGRPTRRIRKSFPLVGKLPGEFNSCKRRRRGRGKWGEKLARKYKS